MEQDNHMCVTMSTLAAGEEEEEGEGVGVEEEEDKAPLRGLFSAVHLCSWRRFSSARPQECIRVTINYLSNVIYIRYLSTH